MKKPLMKIAFRLLLFTGTADANTKDIGTPMQSSLKWTHLEKQIRNSGLKGQNANWRRSCPYIYVMSVRFDQDSAVSSDWCRCIVTMHTPILGIMPATQGDR